MTSGQTIKREEDKRLWREDGEKNKWRLPPRAGLFWRLPIIRHVRTTWTAVKIEIHYRYGLGTLGAFRTGYDEWVCYAMWRGWV